MNMQDEQLKYFQSKESTPCPESFKKLKVKPIQQTFEKKKNTMEMFNNFESSQKID